MKEEVMVVCVCVCITFIDELRYWKTHQHVGLKLYEPHITYNTPISLNFHETEFHYCLSRFRAIVNYSFEIFTLN